MPLLVSIGTIILALISIKSNNKMIALFTLICSLIGAIIPDIVPMLDEGTALLAVMMFIYKFNMTRAAFQYNQEQRQTQNNYSNNQYTEFRNITPHNNQLNNQPSNPNNQYVNWNHTNNINKNNFKK